MLFFASIKNTGQDLSLEQPKRRLPEHNLLASVVERAIFDIKSTDPEVSRSANKWIFSHATGPWSCRWVLEQLEMTNGLEALRYKVSILKEEIDAMEIGSYRAHSIGKMLDKFNELFLLK